ncbi:MAG: hypothetical protein JHC95_20475 [Solirubrobacteraceae bacterium]|nr:hypothetical protein [Solirubrobacteraceae bacterium]
MTLRVARPARALLAALALTACAPATASATSELFVQSATTATATPVRGNLFTLTLRGTPATILRFDDRPQRRSSRVSVDTYVDLWRGDFGRDAPNAALVGTRGGRNSETVVELLSARKIRGGVRYTVRARNGRPARRLRDVSLFVDPINAVHFSAQLAPIAAENITITPESPLFLTSRDPLTLVLGTLTFQAGASLIVNGSTLVIRMGDNTQTAALAAASSPAPVAVGDGFLYWTRATPGQIVIRPSTAITVTDVTISAA